MPQIVVHSAKSVSSDLAEAMRKHFNCDEYVVGVDQPELPNLIKSNQRTKQKVLYIVGWELSDKVSDSAIIVSLKGALRAMKWEVNAAYPSVRKESNPKEAIGASKWRILSVLPMGVIWEAAVGMLEGALKYGRHNYRSAGVRASIYYDATMGHLTSFWEGEDIDEDSQLSHITKAITSLITLRDGMMQGKWVDDRPPKSDVPAIRAELQQKVDALLAKYPNPVKPFCEIVEPERVDG